MINNCVLIIIILICFISYYAFILPKKDKILFALYKNRDDLTLYAMENPGKQKTEEYKYVIQSINIEIYMIKKNFSFSDFYKKTVERTAEREKEVEKIICQIEQDAYIKQIFEDSFDIFSKYINKKFKLFYILVLRPVTFILSIIMRFLELFTRDNLTKVTHTIGTIFEKTSNMSQNYETYIRVNRTF